VAVLFSNENVLVPLVVVMSTVLFFVRVNQVLVRLWARTQLSVFSRRLSEVSDERPRGTDDGSLLRLMSDRESVSGVSTPLSGVLKRRVCAPKSDNECSEAFV
jgi:hypothetical protein